MSFTQHITGSFYNPPHAFFQGLVASQEGIGDEVIQIGDHFYLLDLASDRYKVFSVPAFKPQEDSGERPGERTLSDAGLWRRHVSSWHHGAGQTWYDRNDSDPYRFRASRGVDPFERWRLHLLWDTESIETNLSGITSLAVGHFGGTPKLVAAGGNGYCVTIDAAGTATTVTGLTGTVYVTSTGSQVYAADSTGIYPLNAAGNGIGTAFNTNITGAKIWFAKDRLWAAVGAALYNVIDSTTSTAHYTHAWAGWEWTSVNEGGEHAYATGFSGDKGRVYSIGIASDATTLLPPLVALPLPDGEVPYSVAGYAGFVAVGTSLGLRLCQADGTALVSGPIIGFDEHTDHNHPVRCIEGQGSFLWFGQDSIFDDAAGLGRVDLRSFLEGQPLAPAYATDLMGAASDEVPAVATFDERRWFVVGDTLYRQTDTLVNSGTLDSGRITMNIVDMKVAVYIDIRHDALPPGGNVEVWETNASQVPILRGVSNQVGTERPVEPFSTNHNRTIWHEVSVTLNQADEQGPSLTAVSLAAQPVPDRSVNLVLPILLHEVIVYADQEFSYDIEAEFQFLRDLAISQRLIRFRHGKLSYLGFVEDFEWEPHQPQQDGQFFNGTMFTKLKTAEVQR